MTYKSIPSSNIVDMSPSAIRSPKTFAMGGSLKTLTKLIKALFANGEQGFAYDPNDLTTLYQDAAGTTPVTAAGQPVGLMLDKSKGLVLGSELIIGGSFEDGLIGTKSEGTGSVSTWELNTTDPISGTKDGKLTITTASATRPTLRFPVASNAVMGKTYRLTFNYKVTSGVAIISQLNNGSASTTVVNKTLTGSGTFAASIPWQGESTVQPFIYFGESIATIQIDNVSFKELVGSHAYQPTSSMRPLLVANPQHLDYDNADDKLITNLPTQLTGCTVIRAVPNVGTQILTNQTIPTTYNDNIDNCGLIVINRALTASETSQITKLFNKSAGV